MRTFFKQISIRKEKTTKLEDVSYNKKNKAHCRNVNETIAGYGYFIYTLQEVTEYGKLHLLIIIQCSSYVFTIHQDKDLIVCNSFKSSRDMIMMNNLVLACIVKSRSFILLHDITPLAIFLNLLH